ncbi:glutamate--tRNA ligase [Patescibacteria group bacterium]|nr:glutamate--tRNA ligase [Patescibacteria group bacterium]MBU4162170.1 glutamate--tRNA ligase [Patescibacteria group bacterium]
MEAIAKKIENPRVRIAPSPTGFLHIGTARTALFNYLFAKKYNGSFVLRIEDTDKERSQKEYEDDVFEGLKWLKIPWDEGVNPDDAKEYIGDFGPYRQSERIDIYESYIKKMLEQGTAYYCFCSKEDLEAQRQYQMSIGQAPKYDGKCSDIPKETAEQYLKERRPSVIRFRTPAQNVVFQDLIKGKIEFNSALLGDMAIAKDIKTPLYNLAAVIDDYEMKISHVIRGEDHISNTPKQILLQDALGLPHPDYAHLPLILGADRSKLSKRHGAVSVNEYREKGYLSEAMINFMAFLGWNPDTDREIYAINHLVEEFSLEHCQKSSAVFNIQKLDWINGFYIRNKSPKKLTELSTTYLIEANLIQPIFETGGHLAGIGGIEIEETYLVTETKEKIDPIALENIIALYQERLKYLSELPELVDFFFKKELDYQMELLFWKDMAKADTKKAIDALEGVVEAIKPNDWGRNNLEEILVEKATEMGPEGDKGYLLWPFRVALSGKKSSAPPFAIAEILGKEKTLLRLKQAKEKLE